MNKKTLTGILLSFLLVITLTLPIFLIKPPKLEVSKDYTEAYQYNTITLTNLETAEIAWSCENENVTLLPSKNSCIIYSEKPGTYLVKATTQYFSRTISVDFSPHTHIVNPDEHILYLPDCLNPGVKIFVCPICKQMVSFENIPIIDQHHYEEYLVETYPTCTEKGCKILKCQICGKEISEDIPPLGHNFGNDEFIKTENGQAIYKQSCLRCGVEGTTYKTVSYREDGITIPRLNISIALGYVETGDEDFTRKAQRYVDMYDCGAYMNFHDYILIGDHNLQGFCNLKNVQIGDIAFIYGKKVQCYEITYGTNDGRIILNDGRTQLDFSNYVLYTCSGGWKNAVLVTFWR